MKEKVTLFINENNYFIKFIYTLIILNIVALILESYHEVDKNYHDFFGYFEIF